MPNTGGFLVFNEDQARRLSRMFKAASTDDGRPILTGVNLEWETTSEHRLQLHAVATDSYRIGIMRCDIDTEAGRFDGTVIVNAKQLGAAITNVIKHQRRNPAPEARRVVVTFDPVDNTVTVSGSVPDAPIGYPAVIEGTYPTWRKLVNLDDPYMNQAPTHPEAKGNLEHVYTQLADIAEGTADMTANKAINAAMTNLGAVITDIGGAGQLPALNPQLLREGLDTLGTTADMRRTDKPVRLIAPDCEHSDLVGYNGRERSGKPWGFTYHEPTIEYWYLQMPVMV